MSTPRMDAAIDAEAATAQARWLRVCEEGRKLELELAAYTQDYAKLSRMMVRFKQQRDELLEAMKEADAVLVRAYEAWGTNSQYNPERCALELCRAAIEKAKDQT